MNDIDIDLKPILNAIGKNNEIKGLMSRSEVYANFIKKSLWYDSIISKGLNPKNAGSLIIGSIAVCFPEYAFLIENSDYDRIYSMSIALCYLFPNRVANAEILDAISPDIKSSEILIEEVIVSFIEKFDFLEYKYEPYSEFDAIKFFPELQFLIDDEKVSYNDLKKSLDVLFNNTF